MSDVDKELEQFFEAIKPLSDQTLALLIQLPPSIQILEGLESLREFVRELDTGFRYAYVMVSGIGVQFLCRQRNLFSLESTRGVEDPISSRNRFHIFEINRGPEHSRKGFWPDTN